MFLEVYAISLNDYSKDTDASVRPENKRLLEMTGVRIRSSAKFQDRAEVVLPNGDVLLAVGSYDDLIQRIESTQTVIAHA